jgi:hypothetical protein
VTTLNQASKAVTECKVLLPTFFASNIDGAGTITSTKKCPQKYYCPGGTPTNKLDTAVTPLVLTSTTVQQCANETWTEGIGASSANQCSK